MRRPDGGIRRPEQSRNSAPKGKKFAAEKSGVAERSPVAVTQTIGLRPGKQARCRVRKKRIRFFFVSHVFLHHAHHEQSQWGSTSQSASGSQRLGRRRHFPSS
jgi:hypothetical protein